MHQSGAMARDVRNLEVFQQADALFFRVVAVSATIGRPGRFSFCDQLTRAALSVPVNLVEGSQRSTTRDYARFVEIAAGSAAETGYLLSVASRLAPRDMPISALAAEYDVLVRRIHVLHTRLRALDTAARVPGHAATVSAGPPPPAEP